MRLLRKWDVDVSRQCYGESLLTPFHSIQSLFRQEILAPIEEKMKSTDFTSANKTDDSKKQSKTCVVM